MYTLYVGSVAEGRYTYAELVQKLRAYFKESEITFRAGMRSWESVIRQEDNFLSIRVEQVI